MELSFKLNLYASLLMGQAYVLYYLLNVNTIKKTIQPPGFDLIGMPVVLLPQFEYFTLAESLEGATSFLYLFIIALSFFIGFFSLFNKAFLQLISRKRAIGIGLFIYTGLIAVIISLQIKINKFEFTAENGYNLLWMTLIGGIIIFPISIIQYGDPQKFSGRSDINRFGRVKEDDIHLYPTDD